MKKVLLLFVALFIATAVNAQNTSVTLGPKVGYQTSKLSVKRHDVKSDFKGNMTFGVFGRLAIDRFVLQPELLYYKSGKVLEVNAFGNGSLSQMNPTFTVHQSNLVLPIFLGYQFVDKPTLKMRANVGPVFYFAVGKTEYSSNLFDSDYVIKTSHESFAEDTSIGAALNLGIDIWKFTIDVNYSLGLSDAVEDEIEIPGFPEFEIGEDTKQNVFTVTLGFKLL